MRKLSLREVQKIEYDILEAFDQFCKLNHFTYMLSGGTLLGAIRHQGFIPWDDDVDVLMPRGDYDRFLGMKTEYICGKKDYEIKHWKNGKSCYPFIKIVDPDSYVETEYIRSKSEVQQIWIDIFPLDGNPEDMESAKHLYKKVKKYKKLLILKLAKIGVGSTWYIKLIKPLISGILQVIPTNYLCLRMDQLSKLYSYEESTKVGCILWGYGVKECMDKSVFQEQKKILFEEKYFPAPVGYHQYLTGLYGDYMTLPPEKDRLIHIFNAYTEENERE